MHVELRAWMCEFLPPLPQPHPSTAVLPLLDEEDWVIQYISLFV